MRGWHGGLAAVAGVYQVVKERVRRMAVVLGTFVHMQMAGQLGGGREEGLGIRGWGERFGKAICRLRAVEQKAAKETKEMNITQRCRRVIG